VRSVTKVHRDLRAHKVSKVSKVRSVTKVHRDLKVLKVFKV